MDSFTVYDAGYERALGGMVAVAERSARLFKDGLHLSRPPPAEPGRTRLSRSAELWQVRGQMMAMTEMALQFAETMSQFESAVGRYHDVLSLQSAALVPPGSPVPAETLVNDFLHSPRRPVLVRSGRGEQPDGGVLSDEAEVEATVAAQRQLGGLFIDDVDSSDSDDDAGRRPRSYPRRA